MLIFGVTNKRERQQLDHESGPLEFGRGPKRENIARCVITDDLYVSKDHVRVEEYEPGRVRIDNLSQRNPIWLGDNTIIAPNTQRELAVPVRLTVGETTIEINTPVTPPSASSWNESLATIEPVRSSRLTKKPSLANLGQAPGPEKLAQWLETVITVQRAASGSAEFYNQTAQALVDLVGLDVGLVLVRREREWEVIARATRASSGSEREFSYTILDHVLKEGRTFYQSAANVSSSSSLQGIEAVVASPIFDGKDQVVGVLYGTRNQLSEAIGSGIGSLEAQVVQILASAAGAGIARQEQEAEASRIKVQFEQFFSPNLARELQRNPLLLEGAEREVTVMFADLRGFSRVAEGLSPLDTCRLIREIMEHLTTQVRNFDGVVVDYTGDGLMAMWNAPSDQEEHASLACRAALRAMQELPRVSEGWKNRLGGPLSMGLGLNTGVALVGNTGSLHKFKYGPLGHTVNLASRVEGATKQLGIPILVTGSTKALLGEKFATRRLCRVRVVNIRGAVDLFELHAETVTPQWREFRDGYETALTLFEAGHWKECCKSLYPLLGAGEGNLDIPTLNLLTRAIECLKAPPKSFDPVLELTSK